MYRPQLRRLFDDAERDVRRRASTLATFGAVSKETATQMAVGALERAGVDLAVSITGIAGPGGAVPGEPVGLVHFAVAARDGRISQCAMPFRRDRPGAVRQRSVVEALRMLMDMARGPKAAKPKRAAVSRIRPRVTRSRARMQPERGGRGVAFRSTLACRSNRGTTFGRATRC